MQRVRVGVTGLAAVVLVVALATAIATGVQRSAATDPGAPAVPGVTATLDAGNAVEAKSEPLAQLGVAPDAKDVTVPAAKRPH